eukprot:scaffold68691_cov54-Phaeocystis_antarctica.AAC.1
MVVLRAASKEYICAACHVNRAQSHARPGGPGRASRAAWVALELVPHVVRWQRLARHVVARAPSQAATRAKCHLGQPGKPPNRRQRAVRRYPKGEAD